MPRHRREVATTVAEQLFATEAAIDAALNQASAFLAMLPAARQDAQLAAGMAQPTIERVVATIAALGTARGEIVAAHDALADVQKRLGLAEVNFGAFIKMPEWPKEENARLRVVERRAA